jgi:UPF0042 nucleotide-binding protein
MSELQPKPGPAAPERQRVLVVTGMSGAGKTAALKTLEDMGYEAVDNLPLSLLTGLLQPSESGTGRPLAIGVDIRTRDFGVEPFLHGLDELIAHPELEVKLLFLDCEDEVLRRRYTETRRRHPLALDRPVSDGIAHERRLVSPLRDRADTVIDTSTFAAGDLRRVLLGQFSLAASPELAVFVVSFSYRHGLPREADLVFDVRFLENPHYVDSLRPLSGRDRAVADYVRRDPGWQPFFQSITHMLKPLIPRFSHEGKSYLTIGVGCTGGRHRSVFAAEELAEWLRSQGLRVGLAHRDMQAHPAPA